MHKVTTKWLTLGEVLQPLLQGMAQVHIPAELFPLRRFHRDAYLKAAMRWMSDE